MVLAYLGGKGVLPIRQRNPLHVPTGCTDEGQVGAEGFDVAHPYHGAAQGDVFPVAVGPHVLQLG